MPQRIKKYTAKKWCAPTCTIQCVHQVGQLDAWRDKQISPTEFNRKNGNALKKETAERVLGG